MITQLAMVAMTARVVVSPATVLPNDSDRSKRRLRSFSRAVASFLNCGLGHGGLEVRPQGEDFRVGDGRRARDRPGVDHLEPGVRVGDPGALGRTLTNARAIFSDDCGRLNLSSYCRPPANLSERVLGLAASFSSGLGASAAMAVALPGVISTRWRADLKGVEDGLLDVLDLLLGGPDVVALAGEGVADVEALDGHVGELRGLLADERRAVGGLEVLDLGVLVVQPDRHQRAAGEVDVVHPPAPQAGGDQAEGDHDDRGRHAELAGGDEVDGSSCPSASAS